MFIALGCVALICLTCGWIFYDAQEKQEETRQLRIDTLQEKIDDMKEQHDYEKLIRERQQYIKNNLFVFSYYQENNSIHLRTLASANGTVQVTIAPLPGIYPEYDNITVNSTHHRMAPHDEPLAVQQITKTVWQWNESIHDTTEHWFQITNDSLDTYTVYVTKEVEPLNGYHFMPKQKEYTITIKK
jgi:hypothetical protein